MKQTAAMLATAMCYFIIGTTAHAQNFDVQQPTAPSAHIRSPDMPRNFPVPTAEQLGQNQRKSNSFETTRFPSRFVYLNGVNISTLRGQDLENVNVKIDDSGNVHILAPQYEVSQDPSYHPLLPGELPRFPKSQPNIEGLPRGTFSKETGQNINAPQAPVAPEMGDLRPQPGDSSLPPPISAPKAEPRRESKAEKQEAKPDGVSVPPPPSENPPKR